MESHKSDAALSSSRLPPITTGKATPSFSVITSFSSLNFSA